jgi:[acyl-carrier-protein] S-malonyltransferase
MPRFQKIAFLFPGQGAQYPGMARDFYDHYAIAKETFEESDELLNRKLSSVVFEGPEQALTETRNSQLGIFVSSLAILRVIRKLFPTMTPSLCAGLSLGEYTALSASGRLAFADGVGLVDQRARYMNDACETTQGTMAVILGLDADAVEQLVKEVNLPNDLWAANFNCPGQVVISGTLKGIEAGTTAAKAKGAKRVLPLQVHGAFHSGLMKAAEEKLTPHITHVPLKESSQELVMNVTGGPVHKTSEIRDNLIMQVTHPVRWEQGIRHMARNGVDLFVELGCGKTLAGFNKRIGVSAPMISIEKIADIHLLEELLKAAEMT